VRNTRCNYLLRRPSREFKLPHLYSFPPIYAQLVPTPFIPDGIINRSRLGPLALSGLRNPSTVSRLLLALYASSTSTLQVLLRISQFVVTSFFHHCYYRRKSSKRGKPGTLLIDIISSQFERYLEPPPWPPTHSIPDTNQVLYGRRDPFPDQKLLQRHKIRVVQKEQIHFKMALRRASAPENNDRYLRGK